MGQAKRHRSNPFDNSSRLRVINSRERAIIMNSRAARFEIVIAPMFDHEPAPAARDAKSIVQEHARQFLAPLRSRHDALLAFVAGEHGLSPAELLSPGKTRRVMAARRELVFLVATHLAPPLNRDCLAAWLNISRAAFYRMESDVNRRALSEPEFAKRLESLLVRAGEALKRSKETEKHGSK